MTTLRVRFLSSIIAVHALTGCGGVPINEVKTALAAANPCCAGYDTITYGSLSNGNRTKVNLTTSSPALQTSEGLAYFAAFRLPLGISRLEVQALNTEYLSKATYPDPLLILLDSRYRKVAELKDLPLVRGRHVIVPRLFEYHFGTVVTLPVEAQYVLVFARPDSNRRQSAVSDNGTHWAIPGAPIGTLALVPR